MPRRPPPPLPPPQDGLTGLYRGFAVTLSGVVVYRAVFFGGFDAAKGALLARDSPLAATWALAQAVTTAAGVVSYPFDTVRRRLMMTAGRADVVYKSALDCCVKTAAAEGVRGFFKGALTNALRGSAGAVVLVAYDELHKAAAVAQP